MVKLPPLKVLFIIKCGLLSFVHSQNLQISTRFMSGNVIFTWTPSNYSSYYILITRDTTGDRIWTRVSDTKYTVRDVLLYDNITINVRTPGSATDNRMAYNVFKIKIKVGDTVNLSWTAPFFPVAGLYIVYNTYRKNRTVFRIESCGVSYGGFNQSTKYTYLTRPYNSTNIMFEIRDITLDDAGYYNGGSNDEAAWSGGGVVLIVHNKPSKPKITGDLNVEVNRYIALTCSSQSSSAPDYYTKLVTLSHTWLVNETKMGREIRDTLRLKVTKDFKYNKYSCTATEHDMESDRSDPVQINPLYLDDILLYMNGEIKSNIELNENAPLRISCRVDGNPAPTIRLSRSLSDTQLRKIQGTWLNYTRNTAQCTDTDTYTCSGSSTGSNITDKVININVLCITRFDKAGRFKSSYGSKSGMDTTINVAVPIIANPPPQSSDFKWDGPVSVSARTTLSTGDVSYKHVIESVIPVKDHTYFGNYTLSYKGQPVTRITINAEDNLLENPSMESSGEVASRSFIIAISLVSILLGLTWFMVAMFVIYDRRYRNIHQKSKHGEESTQLQTQNMTHHYDDLQGTDVDQLEAQNMTQHYDDVQGRVEEGNYTDLKGDNTAAEGDYTELGQRDPETPYEEL